MDETKNITLPENDSHWKVVSHYMEKTPDPEYQHAPQESREAFMDMKYGVRIHWGLYSLMQLQEESWPFLKMSDEGRQSYQKLYERFNPQGFNADEWMNFFKKAGFSCFAFTTKHHEGFSMYDTKTKVKRRVNWIAPNGPEIEECDFNFSVMDSPFKRDIVGELCEAAHKYNIKIDLYYSHPDWYDADFRPYCYHPLITPGALEYLSEHEISETDKRYGGRKYTIKPNLTTEEKTRMVERHREQLTELLTNYGKIDMICLDMWFEADIWPEIRETMKILRKIRPDVMFRARAIGNYGDYYTPEGFVPGSKQNTDMPWMVIYPLGQSFSYDPDESRYKGSEWVIRNLVDTVSKGGNFMVGIGPDENGYWHPKAIEVLEEAGKWLEVNGEAIYCTRPRLGTLYKEGEDIYFTRTKDSKYTYAISLKLSGRTLNIKTVHPIEGSDIFLLGNKEPLQWSYDALEGLKIDVPENIQESYRNICKMAYSFKIQTTQE